MTFDQKIALWTLAFSAIAAIAAIGVPILLAWMAERESKTPKILATWRGVGTGKGLIRLEIRVSVTVPYCVHAVAIVKPRGSTLAQASPTDFARGVPDAGYKPEIKFAHNMRLPTDGPLSLDFAIKDADPIRGAFVVRVSWKTERKGTTDIKPILV